MTIFWNQIFGSMVVIVIAIIMICVASSLPYFKSHEYQGTTGFWVSEVFFWFGVGILLSGMANFLRAAACRSRQAYRGRVLGRRNQTTDPVVMVVMQEQPGNQRGQLFPGTVFYTGQVPTVQPPYPTAPPSMPVVPPSYEQAMNDYTEKSIPR